jgi:hypothetical protein
MMPAIAMLKQRHKLRISSPATASVPGLLLMLAAGVVACIRPAVAADVWVADQVSVTETLEGQPGEVTTRFEKANNGDVRITLDLSDGQRRTHGVVLLVAGKWLLSRELPQAARPIDYVDAAALNSQLVLALLRAGAPQGPPEAGRTAAVAVTEPTRSIHVSTSTASGDFAAPWNLNGTLSVPSPHAPTDYHLTLRYHAEDHDRTMHLTGSAGNAARPFDLGDDTSLAGWTVHRLSGHRAPGEEAAATLGALRRLP